MHPDRDRSGRGALNRAARTLAGLMLAGSALLAAAQTAPTPVTPQRVSPSAWFVQGLSALGSPANQNFISNAGFVVTPAGVVVIDALGSPALAERLLAQIRRITPQPVTHVVLTHYHADHIYGLQALQAAGAKVLAHQGAREYLNSDTARLRLQASRTELAPWIDAQTRLVEPDEWITGPRELVLGGVRLQLIPVGPAHTPEDLVVHLPQEKVLFAGDLVFASASPSSARRTAAAGSARWTRCSRCGRTSSCPGTGHSRTTPAPTCS